MNPPKTIPNKSIIRYSQSIILFFSVYMISTNQIFSIILIVHLQPPSDKNYEYNEGDDFTLKGIVYNALEAMCGRAFEWRQHGDQFKKWYENSWRR